MVKRQGIGTSGCGRTGVQLNANRVGMPTMTVSRQASWKPGEYSRVPRELAPARILPFGAVWRFFGTSSLICLDPRTL